MAFMNSDEQYLGIRKQCNTTEYTISSSYPDLIAKGYDVYDIFIGYKIPPFRFYAYQHDSNRIHIHYVSKSASEIMDLRFFLEIGDVIDHIKSKHFFDYHGYSVEYETESNVITISSGEDYPTFGMAVEAGMKLQYDFLKQKIQETDDKDLEKVKSYYLIKQILDYENAEISVQSYINRLRNERKKQEEMTPQDMLQKAIEKTDANFDADRIIQQAEGFVNIIIAYLNNLISENQLIEYAKEKNVDVSTLFSYVALMQSIQKMEQNNIPII